MAKPKTKQPWDDEKGPDASATTPPEGTNVDDQEPGLDEETVVGLSPEEIDRQTMIVMGKLAEAGVLNADLEEASSEAELDTSDRVATLAFMQEQLELTKPKPVTIAPQTPLALANLISQGFTMKDAKKHLGMD